MVGTPGVILPACVSIWRSSPAPKQARCCSLARWAACSGGAGGSYAFADPENRVSYPYVMNKYVTGSTGDDQRSDRLVRALYAALEGRA